MTKKQIWLQIASSNGVEDADLRAESVYEEYANRFERFTRLNVPKWADVESGCNFEGVPLRCHREKDGEVMLAFSSDIKHVFYLPLGRFETPEEYWKSNAAEFLDACLEVMDL